MRNIRLDICYDGTRYRGWQRLPGKDDTLQGKLEATLSRILGEQIEISGSGRTDAGVHARGQVANFHCESKMSCDELLAMLRQYLPEDICIEDVRIASERFHSRYNAIGKTYCYTCYIGEGKPVFDRKYVYTPPMVPDVELMRKATQYLIGEHDFASFCAKAQKKKSTVRHVDKIEIVEDGAYLRLTYHGNGFLYNMVRILTGTLIEVGRGMRNPEEMKEIIDAQERGAAGFTAPAQGLYLVEVEYEI